MSTELYAVIGLVALGGAYWYFSSSQTQNLVQEKPSISLKRAPASSHTTQYSIEEIAKHNKESDLWIIVGTNVYDLTDFVHDHPGEVESIVKRSGAGQDATSGFRGFQHPDSVEDQIRQYLVGQLKEFELEEVAKHNKKDDCWIIINNKVYDVSSFVGTHPGGEAILKNAGKNSTEGFKRVSAHGKKDGGNYSGADLEMAKYLIGQVKQNKAKSD